MIPRLLAAVLAVPVLAAAPHLLGVLAGVIRFAVSLGPHSLVMLAFTFTLAAVLVILWRIDVLTMRTGWGIVPVRVPGTATGSH